MIFLLHFGTILTVWYFLLSILLQKVERSQTAADLYNINTKCR